MDGTMRVLLVLLAVAVAGYFLLPGGTSGQRQDIYGGAEPADVFGLRPQGQGDTEASPRLRLPPGVGNGMAPERYRNPPDDDGERRGRYRHCGRGSQGRFECGSWEDSAPAQRGGGRW
jgi:hypothetical protein